MSRPRRTLRKASEHCGIAFHLRVVISLTERHGSRPYCAAPKRRGATAMTFFPLSLKAIASIAIAALAGEQEGDKAKPPMPSPAPLDADDDFKDDDFEDGDIATPTRDRHGN